MDCWELLSKVGTKSRRTVLYGPPGTGKTTAGYLLAKEMGWEHVALTLTEDTPASALLGHYVLRGGEFEWQDGLLLGAWRRSWDEDCKGMVCVINEIDHAGGDVESQLHALLDDEEMAQITIATGETLRPAPGKIKYVATMNGIPEDLPAALRDRFPVSLHIDKVNPNAIEALPKDLRNVAANGAVVKDVERRVSVRSVFEFARLRPLVGDQPAADAVFGRRGQEFLDAIKIAGAGE